MAVNLMGFRGSSQASTYLCLRDVLASDSCYETGYRECDGRIPWKCLGRHRVPLCYHEVNYWRDVVVEKGSFGLT